MVALTIIAIFLGTALGISIYSLKKYLDYKEARECYEELIVELIEELNTYRESDND